MNSMFLVIIDAHSKWVEIFRTSTSTITIQCLRFTFSRFGIPHTIVSDNGSCFTSTEFGKFLRLNGINSTIPPTVKRAGRENGTNIQSRNEKID